MLDGLRGSPFSDTGGGGGRRAAAALPAAAPAQPVPACFPANGSGAEVPPATTSNRPCPPAPRRHKGLLPPPPEVPHSVPAALRGSGTGGPAGGSLLASGGSGLELHPALALAHAWLADIEAGQGRFS